MNRIASSHLTRRSLTALQDIISSSHPNNTFLTPKSLQKRTTSSPSSNPTPQTNENTTLTTSQQEIKDNWATLFDPVIPNLFDTTYMLKATNQIKELLQNNTTKGRDEYYRITCIIEVRNVRMPYSQHPIFQSFVEQSLKHVIVFTYSNFLSDCNKDCIKKNILSRYKDCDDKPLLLFMDLTNHKGINGRDVEPYRRQILNVVTEATMEHNNDDRHTNPITHVSALVIGLPNVGKSALTYILSKESTRIMRQHKTKHLPRINNKPGVTTLMKVHWFDLKSIQKDKHNRNIYFKSKLIDTPGISLPKDYIKKQCETNKEYMMQLGLVGCLPTKATKRRAPILVQYLLYRLNQAKNYDYVQHFNLDKRTNDVNVLLRVVDSTTKGKLNRKNDRNKFAELIIMDWRNGLFGRDIILDTNHNDYLDDVK